MIHVVEYTAYDMKFVCQYGDSSIERDFDLSCMKKDEWEDLRRRVRPNVNVWMLGLRETFYFKIGKELWK